jgi:hypothetical protein
MIACTGSVCVNCCRCETCGRKVGTRHLDACACGPEQRHWYCGDCAASNAATALSGEPTPALYRRTGEG